MENTFGDMVRMGRNAKGWTGIMFRKKMLESGGKMSMAYIVQLENHDEIPSRDMVLNLSKLLDLDPVKMMELAKQGKRRKLDKALDLKYKI